MPKVTLYSMSKSAVGEIDLEEKIFAAPENTYLYYEVVKMQLARRRGGNASTKNRSEIVGSTAKLYRQKGTGRARKGSIKSGILRGGGTMFGPSPRDFGYSVPKRVRKAALRSALSKRLAEDRLFVIDDMAIDWISTKKAAKTMAAFGAGKTLVVDTENDQLFRSVRNIDGYKFLKAMGVNVYDVLNHENLVLSKSAVKHLEGVLGNDR
jgi:large subunit ribosomal protein L4